MAARGWHRNRGADPVTAFADTFACQSRAHCATCRVDAAWRTNVGAPDVCPHGSRGLGDTVAPESDPVLQTDAGRERLAICQANECESFKCVCHREYPQAQGRCNGGLEKMKLGFHIWLDDPASECPADKWKTLAPVGAEGV